MVFFSVEEYEIAGTSPDALITGGCSSSVESPSAVVSPTPLESASTSGSRSPIYVSITVFTVIVEMLSHVHVTFFVVDSMYKG